MRGLAQVFKERFDRLDVLINNVGGLFGQRFETEDGVEATYAVNALTPFLLTHLLLDVLKASHPARVINLTGGMPGTHLDLDDLQAQKSFVGLQTYSHAKLAMSALSYEFAERLRETGVTLNVTYPGAANTSMTQALSRGMLPPLMRLALPLIKLASRSAPENAARSSIYLASSPEVEGVTATYFNTKGKRAAWSKDLLDPEKRQYIWEQAVHLTGLEAKDSTEEGGSCRRTPCCAAAISLLSRRSESRLAGSMIALPLKVGEAWEQHF